MANDAIINACKYPCMNDALLIFHAWL